jgi:tetratricopeptide (TPR) repeat protein
MIRKKDDLAWFGSQKGLLIAGVLILTQLMSSTSTSAQSESIGAADELVKTGAYREAESMYRTLLKLDKTGDCYGGLAISLTMQDKLAEADVLLKQAQENHLLDNVNVLAAGGCLSYAHANKSPRFREYSLFLASSSALCKRALAIDSGNRIALQTLELAETRSRHLDSAERFEHSGRLDLAEAEYRTLLEKRKDDTNAMLGLTNIYNAKVAHGEEIPEYILELMKDWTKQHPTPTPIQL